MQSGVKSGNCSEDGGVLYDKLKKIFRRFSLPILASCGGYIVWVNELFEKISGYSLDELKGKPLSFLTAEDLSRGMNLAILKRKGGEREKVLWFTESEGELEFHLLNRMEFLKEIFDAERRLDPVTGVLDRVSFMKEVNSLISQSKDAFFKLAILVVDVVRFSDITSLYGIAVADELLFQIAQRIQAVLRKVDIIGRVGVDDFGIVIAPLRSKEDVLRVVDRLFAAFEAPFHVNNQEVRLNINIAVVIYPEDGVNAHQLIDRIHIVLHNLKVRENKNTFSFFQPEYVYETDIALKIRELVPKGIKNREFVLYYQPIVNMKNKSIIACEALLRWDSPELCFMSPMEFLPVLEKLDLIYDLSLYVIEDVCLTIKRWDKKRVNLDFVSFNVSPGLFRNEEFVTEMIDKMKTSSADTSKLCVEITESAVFEFEEKALSILDSVKDLGCKIALDDFGTGYSTLKHVVFMPVDWIKVDRFFVAGLPDNEKDIAVVKTVKALADSVGAKVLAEGVENKKQESYLLSVGYAYAQGFLYAKPLSEDNFLKFLLNGELHGNSKT